MIAVVHSALLVTRVDRALLNVAVLVITLVPGVALGLAIRRAKQQKAVRASDPTAPTPHWMALKANGLELAGSGSRLAALAIDGFIVTFVWGTLRSAQGAGVTHILSDVTFLVAYFSIGNGLGGAVGARVTRIRLVSADGSGPGLVRGTIRHLISYVSGLLVFGYLSGIWDDDGQTWHDKLAGTYVVRRHPAKSPGATLAAVNGGTPDAELKPRAVPVVGQIGFTAAEPKPQKPPLPRGEHEPGCTRRRSPRQRCTPSADEP